MAPARAVLLGPLKTGKSTVGRLLAERLDWSFHSLDVLEPEYTVPAGFDPDHAAHLRAAEGDLAAYLYRRRFFAAAVTGFLRDYPTGVLELGGGHPIVADPAAQARIDVALAACAAVVLIMPTTDRAAALRILNERQRPEYRDPDLNEWFLADDRFWRQATHVVYAEDRPAAVVAAEIQAWITGQPGWHGPAVKA